MLMNVLVRVMTIITDALQTVHIFMINIRELLVLQMRWQTPIEIISIVHEYRKQITQLFSNLTLPIKIYIILSEVEKWVGGCGSRM